MLDIAVIIPCHNEENTVLPTIKQSLTQLRQQDRTYKVYVYDNNSNDKTREKVEKAMTKYPREINYKFEPMQGKGYTMRTAFQEINARCYVMIDGDNTYDQDQLNAMTDKILNENYDMVTGDRLSTDYEKENTRLFHNMGNHFMKTAINVLFRTDYTDVLSGFRAFSYAFAKTFPITSGGFTLETEMSIHAGKNHMRTDMAPVGYTDREDDNSKINTIPDGIRVIYKLIYLYQCYKPMLFYGILSLIPSLLGIGFLIPVIVEFVQTHEVDRFPTLFTCGFAILLGILLFFTGLTQHTNQIRHTQIYENILCWYRTHLTEIYGDIPTKRMTSDMIRDTCEKIKTLPDTLTKIEDGNNDKTTYE